MGLLPQTLGRNECIEWIPVDVLSAIILELALDSSDDATRSRIFHSVNPIRVRWVHSILPVIKARLERSTGAKIKVVTLSTWVEAVKKTAEEEHGSKLIDLPAFKLLNFYAGLYSTGKGERPEFETHETRAASKTLRELEPVSTDWVNAWLDQWGY